MATPEELAARYAGQWIISRDLHPDGTHGALGEKLAKASR